METPTNNNYQNTSLKNKTKDTTGTFPSKIVLNDKTWCYWLTTVK
jgi:hypothetical protein